MDSNNQLFTNYDNN
ncbi:hypothetical protein RB653_006122 [Dictyostelium firmibasis]|uniref:Uncharacterized protein n=1 Tax=Dictyostelium firmibasis TaxID=79012 RepID=A0AAN7Z522_9MYCE